MISQLRDYQARAVSMTYQWLAAHSGNPCVVAPMGSGKSWIAAAFCQDIMERWPDSRILVLSHVKELLEQDAEKILLAWPQAPLGIYSAGLKSRQLDQAITVAGIQSIYKRAAQLPPVDLVLVDEAHLINNQAKGMYRRFLEDLTSINPALRIIGLTATPYRLGQGMLTDGDDALFHGLIEAATIKDLIAQGYLAPLRSKITDFLYDLSKVGKRGGEFIEKELQLAVDQESNTEAVAQEIVRWGAARCHWLIFCAGIDHSYHMRDQLRSLRVPTETITGSLPMAEREGLIKAFKAGQIRALTSVGVLTTGFDYPDIDLIALCRPTLSPGLYLQSVGRGMRIKSHAKNCLVLDFAGNVARHGPVTDVAPPRAAKKKDKAVTKSCPQCKEIVAIAVKACPVCGYQWPMDKREKPPLRLHDRDIMGGPEEETIRGWQWAVCSSRKKGTPMLRVDYYPEDLLSAPISEYFCFLHGAEAGYWAVLRFKDLVSQTVKGSLEVLPAKTPMSQEDLQDLAETMNSKVQAPVKIFYRIEKGYPKILKREWAP